MKFWYRLPAFGVVESREVGEGGVAVWIRGDGVGDFRAEGEVVEEGAVVVGFCGEVGRRPDATAASDYAVAGGRGVALLCEKAVVCRACVEGGDVELFFWLLIGAPVCHVCYIQIVYALEVDNDLSKVDQSTVGVANSKDRRVILIVRDHSPWGCHFHPLLIDLRARIGICG